MTIYLLATYIVPGKPFVTRSAVLYETEYLRLAKIAMENEIESLSDDNYSIIEDADRICIMQKPQSTIILQIYDTSPGDQPYYNEFGGDYFDIM